ncbi:hypothetical protein [Actinoplanes sp. NPDC026623]|uniref:hypothetical protein n=1 Tax=Actinoplanes sp. NPDC026623 TaxID=3155610 RepID=UPI0033FA564B
MSVFRAANSTTAWPAPADPYDDGPTERLASADSDGPAEPPPRRGVVFAVLLAMLALLVSAGSGLIAWRALGRADEAFTRSSAGASAPVTTYTDEELRIQAGCGTTTFVDLDEPRVNVAAAAGDLRFESHCEPDAAPRLAPGPGAAAAGLSKDAAAGQVGCAAAISTAALDGATTVPATKGLILCILTGPGAAPSPSAASPSVASPSASASAASAIDAGVGGPGVRMVRVEVTEVTADGTANLRATSWAVR